MKAYKETDLDIVYLTVLVCFTFPENYASEPEFTNIIVYEFVWFAEGTFEMEKILQFLDYNKFPLVNKLTESNSATVYSSPLKLQVSDTSDMHHTSFKLQLLAYVNT